MNRSFIRRPLFVPLLGAAVILAAGLGSGGYPQYVLGLVAISMMIVLSLDVLLGRLGLISLGHAGFVAIGAYTTSILMVHHWPFLLTLPVAGILATIGGLLLGLPSMRLSGFYLAIATLAFGGVVEQVIRFARPITGGPFGLQVPAPEVFGLPVQGKAYFVVLVGALAGFIFAFRHLERSVAGRSMLAVKASEPAAQSIGINVVGTKLLGFAISGFGAGVAGALYAPLIGFIGPEHFTFLSSVSYVAMAVLGGSGITGALLGAAVITAIPELFVSLRDYSSLVWGAAMLLILFLSPRGLAYLRLRKAAG